jgi:dTDP-4-amino-4,6-dideoxygalactose transaminase
MSIQLFKPKFRNEEIIEHIQECLDKGWTGLGYKTVEIETEWKKYTGLPNAHFINSNTSGLHLAFKILKDANKWNDGDEVITTPLTFVSSNHGIVYSDLHPVFADVDEHLCLDPESVERSITKKTRAVLFVGIGGNMGQFSKILHLCKKYNLKLILDAAHMSGTWFTQIVEGGSSLEHAGQGADVSVFSFQAVKNLPTADSGMICFKNEDYDQLARKLSWLGITKDTYQRSNDKGNYKWEYDLVDVGYKYHGNSIMASMALVGLKYLEEDNETRRKICKMYDAGFSNSNVKIVPHSEETTISSRHLYQIRVQNRNSVMEYLNSNEIFPGVHYIDNTKYKTYDYAKGRCPRAQIASEEVISLPLHTFLTGSDVKRVIDTVLKAIKI